MIYEIFLFVLVEVQLILRNCLTQFVRVMSTSRILRQQVTVTFRMKSRSVNTWRQARSVSQFVPTGISERRSSELMVFTARLCSVSSTSVCAHAECQTGLAYSGIARRTVYTVEAQQVFMAERTFGPWATHHPSTFGPR